MYGGEGEGEKGVGVGGERGRGMKSERCAGPSEVVRPSTTAFAVPL